MLEPERRPDSNELTNPGVDDGCSVELTTPVCEGDTTVEVPSVLLAPVAEFDGTTELADPLETSVGWTELALSELDEPPNRPLTRSLSTFPVFVAVADGVTAVVDVPGSCDDPTTLEVDAVVLSSAARVDDVWDTDGETDSLAASDDVEASVAFGDSAPVDDDGVVSWFEAAWDAVEPVVVAAALAAAGSEVNTELVTVEVEAVPAGVPVNVCVLPAASIDRVMTTTSGVSVGAGVASWGGCRIESSTLVLDLGTSTVSGALDDAPGAAEVW